MSKSTQLRPKRNAAIRVLALLVADCFLFTTLLPPSGFAQPQRSSADSFLRPTFAGKRGTVPNLQKALRSSDASPDRIAVPDGGRRAANEVGEPRRRRERLKTFLEEAFGARVVDKRVMDGDPDHSVGLIGRESQLLLLPGALDGVDLLKAVLEEIERLEELSSKHSESTLYRTFGKKSFPEAKAAIRSKIAEWMEKELAALHLLEEVEKMWEFATGEKEFLSPGDKTVYLKVLLGKAERIRDGLFGLFSGWERSDLYPDEEGTRIHELVNATKGLIITLDNASGPFSGQYSSQDILKPVDQLYALTKEHMVALFSDSAEVRRYVASSDGGRRGEADRFPPIYLKRGSLGQAREKYLERLANVLVEEGLKKLKKEEALLLLNNLARYENPQTLRRLEGEGVLPEGFIGYITSEEIQEKSPLPPQESTSALVSAFLTVREEYRKRGLVVENGDRNRNPLYRLVPLSWLEAFAGRYRKYDISLADVVHFVGYRPQGPESALRATLAKALKIYRRYKPQGISWPMVWFLARGFKNLEPAVKSAVSIHNALLQAHGARGVTSNDAWYYTLHYPNRSEEALLTALAEAEKEGIPLVHVYNRPDRRSNGRQTPRSQLRLDSLLRSIIRDKGIQALAASHRVEVVLAVPGESVMVRRREKPDLVKDITMTLRELIINAILHNQEGGRTGVFLRKSEGGGTADVEIQDTGDGIPDSGEKTSGRGLLLARRLSEHYGAKITVDALTQEGVAALTDTERREREGQGRRIAQGTTVVLTIPLKGTSDAVHVFAQPRTSDGGQRSLKAAPLLAPAFQHPVLSLEQSP